MSEMIDSAFVQKADQTEWHLIETARDAANSGNWIVGECACRWLFTYAKGRTDEAFGELIGLSKVQVYQRRRVFEEFGKIRDKFPQLTWTHFREAVQWDDAEECLNWAQDSEATVAEMRAWRRAQRGEDLFAEDGNSGGLWSENAGETLPAPQERTESASDGNSGFRKNIEETHTGPVEGTSKRTATSAATGKAERAKSSGDKGNPESPSKPVVTTPAQSQLPVVTDQTATVEMALAKIEEMLAFVIDHGTEEERDALLAKLKAVVAGLDPEDTSGKKREAVGASLAVATVVQTQWNTIDGITRCDTVTPKRRQAVQARMKDPYWRENWRRAIDKLRTIDAIRGKNDRNWRADIDWFLRPDTVALTLEGKYDGWTTGNKSNLSAAEKRARSNKAAFAEVFGEDEDRATEEDAVY